MKRFPLRLLGTHLGRNVTVIGLSTGELVIHSTAPFSEADIGEIRSLGTPGWLVEATLFHDTCAREGRRAFPELPYLAPEGFDRTTPEAKPLVPAPKAWHGEIEVLRLEGMPKVREHLFFHRPSRTLIGADLLFNLEPAASAWTFFFMRWVGGLKRHPGMSRFFRMMIRDRDAFVRSLGAAMEWDFDRVIVSHGEIIQGDGKRRLKGAFAESGFFPA